LRGAGAALLKSERQQGASETCFKAPLLDRLLDLVEVPSRQVVLDLGGPSQALLDRLSATRPCRVEIADFVARDALRLADVDEDAGPAWIDAILPAPNAEPLNLIFCWDLPNYLSLHAFRELTGVFGKRAAAGCKLHMLIAYSKREMPATPARYRIREDGQLIQRLPNDELAPAPRYSPEDLGRAVGGFRYERGVLLANGMQEFVYAWPV
jgi:hypothetical protein